MPWVRFVPKIGREPELWKRLRDSSLAPSLKEHGGYFYAMIGKKHTRMYRYEKGNTPFRDYAERMEVIDVLPAEVAAGAPTDMTTVNGDPQAVWKQFTRHLQKPGLSITRWLCELGLKTNPVETTPTLIAANNQTPVMSTYTLIEALAKRDVLKVTFKPNAKESGIGLPWKLTINPKILDAYKALQAQPQLIPLGPAPWEKQRPAGNGSPMPTSTAPAPAPVPSDPLPGRGTVEIAMRYNVPAEKASELAHRVSHLLMRFSKEYSASQEGGVDLKIPLNTQLTPQR